MSVGLALVIGATALGVVAVLIATSDPATEPRRRTRDPGFAQRLTAALLCAGAVLVVSGWVLPAAVVGVAVFIAVHAWQRRDRVRGSDVERTDALASWIENLRDVLIAGDQPVGAIGATVSSCPPTIRGPVRRLSTALGHQDPDVAFRRFADDIDDPLGDLVAAGLLVAVQRGARTVAVLSALAEQARTQADRRRILDAERAPVQREVTLLTLIMGALLLGVLLFGRSEYLAAYDRGGGQLFLAVVVAAYGALLIRVQRLARFPRPGRFLTGGGGTTEPIAATRDGR